jgi:hypothetical protein
MSRPRYLNTNLALFDWDEADIDPVDYRKRRIRRSDSGLDPEEDLVDVDDAECRAFAEAATEYADPDGAAVSGGPDAAKRGCTCLWCGSVFERRQNGGRAQKFCAETCRRSFAKAALRWAQEVVASGVLAREQLRSDPPATRRSISDATSASDMDG